MPDFLKKWLENLSKIWKGITTTQKIIGGVILGAAVIAIVVILTVSTSGDGVPLFTNQLAEEDFDRIATKLSEMNVKYVAKGKSQILVANQATKNRTIMKLAEDGSMPKSRYSFMDIIQSKNITSSKFENDIKLRYAVQNRLEEMLKSSELIEKAEVAFTMPEKSVFTKNDDPVKVSVVLTPRWGVNLREHKREVKGYQELIVNSIDRATAENVVILDDRGIKLNDFDNENEDVKLKITKENLKIRENIIKDYENKLYNAIVGRGMVPSDRLSITVDVKMNFDQEKENRREILPVVLKEDDPNTPYDDGERKYSITVSKKDTKEEFVGPNWIPEGPPGFDTNVPPAYKGALEQITKYVKSENIDNQVFGESNREIVRDPWEIQQITAAVLIDGTWQMEFNDKGKVVVENGGRKRVFTPVDDETIKAVRAFVQQGIGFKVDRGDTVAVSGFKRDRSAEFQKEDEAWKRQQQIFWLLLSVLGGIIILIIGSIIYKNIMKEVERRRRLREEEQIRQHQLARELALKSAEEEGTQVEMSLEDKARLEMQENAVNLAREHPEDVAQLIRTWLQDE